jgi:hypothetical protein
MEYRAGFWSCSDCGEDLVEVLPVEESLPEPVSAGAGVRVVFVSSGGIEANLVRTLLEGSGITVYVLDENINSNLFAGIGVKLAVRVDEEQLARVVLNEYCSRDHSPPAKGAVAPVPFYNKGFSRD